jgi:hypothetical protein
MCVFSISSAQGRMPERRNYAKDTHFAVEIAKKYTYTANREQ